MSINVQATLNFLVPPQGATAVLTATLPRDGNFGSGNYGIDFRSVSQILQGTAFIPQACTIDATSLAAGSFITVTIPSANLNWLVYAGQTRTFQIPALPDLRILLTPSSGTPNINTAWYDYPALPDSQGGGVTSLIGAVSVSSIVPVTIAQLPLSIGVDHGANPPALAANLLATIAANPARLGYSVQNQSADPIQVVFSAAGAAPLSIFILNARAAIGTAGGEIDMTGLPHSGTIQIYGPSAADQVAAREW